MCVQNQQCCHLHASMGLPFNAAHHAQRTRGSLLQSGWRTHSFEDMVTALGQEPATTEEMDALQKYLEKVQQVRQLARPLGTSGDLYQACTAVHAHK